MLYFIIKMSIYIYIISILNQNFQILLIKYNLFKFFIINKIFSLIKIQNPSLHTNLSISNYKLLMFFFIRDTTKTLKF